MSLSLGAVTGIAAAACIALLVVKGMTSAIDPITSLLLFPLFICLVTVVSYLSGDDMYLWSKWKGRFEPYDREERPIRALLAFLVMLAGSIAFVVFFFRLDSTST